MRMGFHVRQVRRPVSTSEIPVFLESPIASRLNALFPVEGREALFWGRPFRRAAPEARRSRTRCSREFAPSGQASTPPPLAHPPHLDAGRFANLHRWHCRRVSGSHGLLPQPGSWGARGVWRVLRFLDFDRSDCSVFAIIVRSSIPRFVPRQSLSSVDPCFPRRSFPARTASYD